MKLEGLFLRPPERVEDGVYIFSTDMKSVSTFGIQWSEFSEVQLDSRNGLKISEERLKRVFGANLDSLHGKLVLEVGCGCGRFTEILLKYGAKVVCVDASSAIFECQNNFREKEDVVFVKGDALKLPFAKESFDIVLCIGVIQHTKSPSQVIKECFSLTKEEGTFIFDQYRITLSTILRTTWIFRPWLKRLSPAKGISVTDKLVAFFLPLHKKLAGNRSIEKILFRISPITTHYSSIPELSEAQQHQWARLNTHDNLTDWFKRLTWKSQLMGRIRKLGPYRSMVSTLPYTFEVRLIKKDIGFPRVEFSSRLSSDEVNSA